VVTRQSAVGHTITRDTHAERTDPASQTLFLRATHRSFCRVCVTFFAPCLCVVVWPLLTSYYKILPIFYCKKEGCGENILRNIVGNKGGLGGGYCTIMCNNAPFSVSRMIFFSNTSIHLHHPPHIQNPAPKKQNKTPNTSKHDLKNTSKSGGGVR